MDTKGWGARVEAWDGAWINLRISSSASAQVGAWRLAVLVGLFSIHQIAVSLVIGLMLESEDSLRLDGEMKSG